MYQKPSVERLGTFRELTRQGFPCTEKDTLSNDGITVVGIGAIGCHVS
jgi:hypothetical protein